MPYCTTNDILERFPEQTLISLTDDDGSGTVNQQRVDAAISDASSLMDLYLAERYSLPLSEIPEPLKKIAVDISLYFIYSGRFDDEIPDNIRTRYKEALTVLQKINEGALILQGAETLSDFDSKAISDKDVSEMIFDKEHLDKY